MIRTSAIVKFPSLYHFDPAYSATTHGGASLSRPTRHPPQRRLPHRPDRSPPLAVSRVISFRLSKPTGDGNAAEVILPQRRPNLRADYDHRGMARCGQTFQPSATPRVTASATCGESLTTVPRSPCSMPAATRSSIAGSIVITRITRFLSRSVLANRPRQSVTDVLGQNARVLGSKSVQSVNDSRIVSKLRIGTRSAANWSRLGAPATSSSDRESIPRRL